MVSYEPFTTPARPGILEAMDMPCPPLPEADRAHLQTHLLRWRRHLHQHPEVGLHLPDTLSYLRQELSTLGLAARDCAGGLLVDLGPGGPRTAWRADMDALALQTALDQPHASCRPGAMHACGHDAHMAIALGLAWVLTRTPCPAPVRLLFQPGEEGCFGARGMLAAGALEGVARLFGLHVGALHEALRPGQFGLRPGPMMAAGDRFRATFRGRGTHGAQPHLGRDPLPAAGAFLQLAQVLPARELAPGRLAVVTVGMVHGGSADNIIPETVELKAIVRTGHPEDRAHLKHRLEAAARGLALAHDLQLDWTWIDGYPAVVNDPGAAALARAAILRRFGPGALLELEAPVATSEDISCFLQEVPGAFLFLGTQALDRGITEPHHSPRFDVDETHLERAVLLAADLCRA